MAASPETAHTESERESCRFLQLIIGEDKEMDKKTVVWPAWETVRLIGRGSYGAVYEIERDVFS